MWVTWFASLVCAFVAVLLGVAAATGRGRLARRSGQVPASLNRTIAIMLAVTGSIILVTHVISDFTLRGLGVIFVTFGAAVVQLGQAMAATGGSDETSR